MAAPLVLFMLLLAQRLDLSAPASQFAIAGYAGMVASIVYLRYFQSLERATWIFLISSLVALGGSAALSVDGYVVSLIFLAVTPVKFGLILNWRQCLKFTIILVAFYASMAIGQIGFGGANFQDALYLITLGVAAMGAGLATTAYAYRTKRTSLHLERKNKEIARLVLEDALTGVLNRRAFNELKNDQAARDPLHLLAVIDLDNFKSINDQYGHDVGDEVLIEFAARLASSCSPFETVYRLGGDEFVILSQSAETSAESLGTIICSNTDKSIETSAGAIYLNVSVGISDNVETDPNPDRIFREADIAVYEAKKHPGSSWIVYDCDLRPKHERVDKLASLLRTAIDERTLEVAFQPQYHIQSCEILGFEALARWQTTEHGQISPEEFIPIAENSNVIVQLDKVVFQKALNLAQEWLLDGQLISINVSGPTLLSNDFLAFVADQVEVSELTFEQIQIEITETQILANREKAIEVCDGLRKLGVSIALDDFGTGFSSLSYLSNLPVNLLKIDRSFVQLCRNPSNQKIMRSIVGLARSLNLGVMIEGIERDWQLKVAQDLGCQFAQGFYFSRPLTAEKCAHLNLKRRSARDRDYSNDIFEESPSALKTG